MPSLDPEIRNLDSVMKAGKAAMDSFAAGYHQTK
jgi:hypothetical protein